MRQQMQHHLVFLSVAAIVMFANLGGPRLWDRDEPRNAGCTLEMLQRGDWVTPYFNAELRTHKPILLYWLMMTSYHAFGVNEFGARFWPAALAVGTAACTYHIGRRLFHPQVGLWAAVILSTTLMFDVAGRAATPDSLLIFFSTASILAYVAGVFRPRINDDPGRSPEFKRAGHWFPNWPWAALMYAMMGLAVLAKGPVGLILPTAVLGMFLLIAYLPPRQESPASWTHWLSDVLRPFAPLHFVQTCWRMRPVTALAVAGVVAIPWYVWVGLRTDGEWIRDFFLTHNLSRAASAMEGHRGSILYYPFAVLLGFFPWSVFAAPLLIDLVLRLRRKDAWHWGYILACCWVLVWVGAFSLSQTKLPSYVTPMYPALSLLAGAYVYRWTRGESLASPAWTKLSIATLAVVGLSLVIALPIALARYLPGEESLGLMGLAPLIAAAGCAMLIRNRQVFAAAGLFATGAACFVISLFAIAAERVDRHQPSHLMLAAIHSYSDHPTIAALDALEPSWVYYGRQPITELTDEDAVTFLSGGADHFIITTRDRQTRLADKLPSDIEVISTTPRFLKRGEIVVLGRNPASLASHTPPATQR